MKKRINKQQIINKMAEALSVFCQQARAYGECQYCKIGEDFCPLRTMEISESHEGEIYLWQDCMENAIRKDISFSDLTGGSGALEMVGSKKLHNAFFFTIPKTETGK